MTKEILKNHKTKWNTWEILIYTSNIYQCYFTCYEKDSDGHIYHNRWELDINKSKGMIK